MPEMTGGQALIKSLAREGVEVIFGLPGVQMYEAINPIADEPSIRFITARHEQATAYMADGYARAAGKPGVCMVVPGPGLLNASAAIGSAFAASSPILVVAGQIPKDSIGKDVGLLHEVNDQMVAIQQVTKAAYRMLAPKEVPGTIHEAFKQLRTGRPRPVEVEIPPDTLAEVADVDLLEPGDYARHAASKEQVDEAVRILADAKDPMIWAGGGVMSAQATEELRELAELLEVPVYTSLPGKSAIDERHPLAIGSGGLSATGPARQWLDESDLMFAVGTSLTATPYGQRFPQEKFLIHAVNDVNEMNKDTICDIGLVGDAKLTLQLIIDAVKGLVGEGGRKSGALARVKAAKDAWWESWMPYLTNDSTPISPYRVIWELNQNLDKENSVVTHDAGAPRDQMAPFYTATTPHSYVGWGKTTHLGASIPLMIGAKMAMPERMCVAFMGDAAFGMSGLDIETSVRAGLPITVVLLNNGIMATYPGGTPTAREQFGVTHMSGDYAQIAMGLGAEGIRVTKASELPAAIKQAAQSNQEGKSVMIDVKTRNEDSRAPNRFAEKNTVN